MREQRLSALRRPLENIRVLVVEDSADAREMLAALLTLFGANVSAVDSVADAMRQFERASFDIVVSDVHMPDEDGLALVRRVRALGKDAIGDLPVVALTADPDPNLHKALLDAGYQRRLLKPVESTELVHTVRDLVDAA